MAEKCTIDMTYEKTTIFMMFTQKVDNFFEWELVGVAKFSKITNFAKTYLIDI